MNQKARFYDIKMNVKQRYSTSGYQSVIRQLLSLTSESGEEIK